MKRIQYITNIALGGLFALGAASCNDFLTLYPQDRVVEENFWEDKNDLEGVRYAAYQQMGNTISKFIIWGDIRSDSYQLNTAFSSSKSEEVAEHDVYKKIVDAQIDSTMTQFDWGGVYNTINYCNKVLLHGPEVLERDPQFTTTEWKELKAEVTALRALNYFYLIRAFKDIPFSTKVINSDEEVMNFSAVNQMLVLDTLIHDVRAVAGQGRNRFVGQSDTRGLITNTAIYAILADMYLWRSALREGRGIDANLWRQDCDSVIYFGQLSLDALANQNEGMQTGSINTGTARTKSYDSGLNNALMIANDDMTAQYDATADILSVPSYTSIFNSGNSIESIFELQFNISDQRKSSFLTNFYGYGNNTATHFAVETSAIDKIYNSNETKKKEDSRMWYSCQTNVTLSAQKTNPYVYKWSNATFSFRNNEVTARTNVSEYNNWIFYRMTDVMLMMAEAYAAKSQITTGNNANDPDLQKCKAIVDAIHKRSSVRNEGTTLTGNANRGSYLLLVMNERQIELLGEGKRWFDLVRFAERNALYNVAIDSETGEMSVDKDINTFGALVPDPREPLYYDGTRGVRYMISTFFSYLSDSDQSNMRNRIKNRYGLYSPVYYMEKKANHGKMEQNPVWDREK